MIESIIAIAAGICIGATFTFFYFRAKMEQWKIETEKKIREDALARSRAVLKGKLAEQLAPIFKVFGYDPSDARFIGNPVDYIIFDGYTKVKEKAEDIPITVVLVDVKTGGANLTYEQMKIKQGIEKGLVKFEVVKLDEAL
jgi:predicted Holliday junction resolvase-like endonuclease